MSNKDLKCSNTIQTTMGSKQKLQLKSSLSVSMLSPPLDGPKSPFDPVRNASSELCLAASGKASSNSALNGVLSASGDFNAEAAIERLLRNIGSSGSENGKYSQKLLKSSGTGSVSSFESILRTKEMLMGSPKTHSSSITSKIKYFSGHKFQVTAAGGENGLGPWNEYNVASPVPQRKITATKSGLQKVHVVTIGKNPTANDDGSRRIKIYEHELSSTLWDLPYILTSLSEDPISALAIIDDILRSPKTDIKLVDKVLPKAMAIKALVDAQNSLQSLYGGWLNPALVDGQDIEAASPTIFVVSYSPKMGTIARKLKDLPKNSLREDVKTHMYKHLGRIIEKLFENNEYGTSFALVCPLGKTENNYFC